MYRSQIYHVFLMTFITYILMIVLPRKSQHKAVLVFNLGYMSGQHIYRMITNFGGWEMDITTQTMLLVARMSSLGFCFKDGALKDEDLLKEQIERKIVKLPSLLEILSYSYFCCGCLIGPFFEYNHYIEFIEERGVYAHIPNTVWPSIQRWLIGHCK
jgi:lysophospholipid acyltransferase 1/2